MKFRGTYRGHVLTQGIFLGDMMSPIKIFSGVICYFLRDIVPCPPFILRLAVTQASLNSLMCKICSQYVDKIKHVRSRANPFSSLNCSHKLPSLLANVLLIKLLFIVSTVMDRIFAVPTFCLPPFLTSVICVVGVFNLLLSLSSFVYFVFF